MAAPLILFNEKQKFYVYEYVREDGSPYYVGKGCGNRDWHRGTSDVKPLKDRSNIIRRYENLSEKQALAFEIFWIAVYGRIDTGTGILRNKTDGGEQPPSNKGVKKSEEHCANISAARKGMKFSDSHVESMSATMKEQWSTGERTLTSSNFTKGHNPWNKGGTHSEETRKKLSLANIGKKGTFTGKTHSTEAREKISAAGKGRVPWNKKPFNELPYREQRQLFKLNSDRVPEGWLPRSKQCQN